MRKRLSRRHGPAPDVGPSAEIRRRFRSDAYSRINARRLEHLAALRLPIFDCRVLQVGAGIGDLAPFFIDRGCSVTVSDGRAENLDVLRRSHPDLEAFKLDLDYPNPRFRERFDIVFCYGLLYHLARPREAIAYIADRCDEMLLIETCVLRGREPLLRRVDEPREPDQALRGIGSRPTRSWVYEQLRQHFEFVYLPTVQPAHPEFPTDWRTAPTTSLTRAVFVASRQALDNPLLTASIPDVQERV